ncbi:MAG TPA: acetyl-CoA C-acetyltransferase [Azospirillaceae bacterium]|nr:acetyl-CoA C-acetyltransferase [Azospirillaceae bacterium]
MPEAYIVAAVRTAGGRRNGRVSGWHPADLAGVVLDALVERAGADPDLVEDVIMGCVGQAGEQASNIARGAVLASKLPERVPGVSVDRQCGSSQQALHFAAATVMSGIMDVVIAAGVESMSRVPMGLSSDFLTKAGYGNYKSPRQEERYPDIVFSQFTGAEMMAEKHGFSKEQMDEFAFQSHQKAIAATQAGRFEREVLPVPVRLPDGTTEMHKVDEGIRFDASREGIAGVKLLREGGRLTAASSSQICDGASGVMVVNERGLKALGVEPLARIHTMAVSGGDPVIMLEEPLYCTDKVLKRAGMSIDDIDLFEVNEAFASVPMAWLKHTGADPERLNVNGGAIALGHPLGASGTKLMATLVHALHDRGKRWGLQTMCEGGGLANATIVERL